MGKISCKIRGIEMSGTGGMAGMTCGRQIHFFLGVACEDKGIRHDESVHIFVVRRGSTSPTVSFMILEGKDWWG